MKKFFKKLWRIITNRALLIALALFVQLALFATVIVFLSFISVSVYIAFSALSVIVCFFIISKDDNPAYKLAWVVPILALPFFGGMLYIVLGRRNMRPKRKKRIRKLSQKGRDKLQELSDGVRPVHERNAKLANFVEKSSGFPVFENSAVKYYDVGEKYAAALIEELKSAEKFIFLEYFIIDTGKFWDSVLEVLKEKAASGVDVRIIYDDVGCLFKLPSNYDKTLKAAKIKTSVFNRLVPSLDIRMNNRSHRKIAVIDGKVAFTGGINIADEYVNEITRFGHWKDTGISVRGAAVNSFTIMFLTFWAASENQSDVDFEPYITFDYPVSSTEKIQPLSGDPNRGQIIENSFIQIINNASRYVYINTPYLIPDNETYTALCLAAKSGVDVRITMPHIPDKKMVFMMSRSFYPGLLKAGVKIYEYVPGFLHAKSLVCDDDVAYVGSCNMDYRSFYLHYECGAILYESDCIADIKQDYLTTLKECKPISYETATDVTFLTKIARSIIRVFAPLL